MAAPVVLEPPTPNVPVTPPAQLASEPELRIALRVGGTEVTLATVATSDIAALAAVDATPTAEAARALLSSLRGRGVQLRRGPRPAPAAPKRRFVAEHASKARRAAAPDTAPEPEPAQSEPRTRAPRNRAEGIAARVRARLEEGQPLSLEALVAERTCKNVAHARSVLGYLKKYHHLVIRNVGPGTYVLGAEEPDQ